MPIGSQSGAQVPRPNSTQPNAQQPQKPTQSSQQQQQQHSRGGQVSANTNRNNIGQLAGKQLNPASAISPLGRLNNNSPVNLPLSNGNLANKSNSLKKEKFNLKKIKK